MGRDRSTATPPSCPACLAALHSFISFTSSISFTSNSLRTLLHNGRPPTPLQSIPYALFLSRRGVYPLSQFTGTSSLRAKPRSHSSLPTTVPSFVFMLLRTLLLSFAFFCTRAKLNSLVFNRLRTLSRKHPGWGTPQEPCQKSRTSRSCSL